MALILYVTFALGISFLCSLLEACLLSARLTTLADRRNRGSRGAGKLLELKSARIDDAISAILILNTISNTLGATLAGAEAAEIFGSDTVGVFSGVLTFLILVFSEIIPKTLGAAYAARLASPVGHVLAALTRLMAPALVLSRALTRMLTRGRATHPLSRSELATVIAAATREGALSPDQSALIVNLLRIDEIQVEDVMTPRTVMFTISAKASIGELLACSEAETFSRIPVYQDDPDNIVGYVLLQEVTKALADGSGRDASLETFVRDVWFIPELSTVGEALRQFLGRQSPIAMVTDEHGSLAGLVTLEDVTETFLGAEIVDESDRIVDLREKAMLLRERRMARMLRKRELLAGVPSTDERKVSDPLRDRA